LILYKLVGSVTVVCVRAVLLVVLLDLLLPALLSNFLYAQARTPPAYRCLVWFVGLETADHVHDGKKQADGRHHCVPRKRRGE
jgi:hypothetical protein